jgi:hypothetical protein
MPLTQTDVKNLMDGLVTDWQTLVTFLNNLAVTMLTDSVPQTQVETNVGSSTFGGTPQAASFQGASITQKNAAAAASAAAAIARTPELAISGALTAVTAAETARADLETKFNTFFAPLSLPNSGFLKNLASTQISKILKDDIASANSALQPPVPPTETDLQEIRDAVDNLSSYPILVSDVNVGGTWRGVPPAGGGGTATTAAAPTSLARTVESAMRDVLGRVPRVNDTRSFLASLKASFDISEMEGHTTFTWNPRAYAGQTDLGGGVTGAQASLWTRARVAVDNAGPLLEKLTPLKIDYDPARVESFRSIIRTTFRTLVDELGIEGGPRGSRVDNLFKQLLGQVDNLPILFVDIPPIGPPTYAQSLFGRLQLEMGLTHDLVTTLDEESDLSNFVALRDYLDSIRLSWAAYRNAIVTGSDLGTGFVQLSRALSVTAESVQEIYAAMDSVFVGEAERQVATFTSTDKDVIIVEDLLTWVAQFASNEAPTLIYEGGIIGVQQVGSTALVIQDLVDQFLKLLRQQIVLSNTLPDGMKLPRVIQPVSELNEYLLRTLDLVGSIKP